MWTFSNSHSLYTIYAKKIRLNLLRTKSVEFLEKNIIACYLFYYKHLSTQITVALKGSKFYSLNNRKLRT
jgi:hypothetical protein